MLCCGIVIESGEKVNFWWRSRGLLVIPSGRGVHCASVASKVDENRVVGLDGRVVDQVLHKRGLDVVLRRVVVKEGAYITLGDLELACEPFSDVLRVFYARVEIPDTAGLVAVDAYDEREETGGHCGTRRIRVNTYQTARQTIYLSCSSIKGVQHPHVMAEGEPVNGGPSRVRRALITSDLKTLLSCRRRWSPGRCFRSFATVPCPLLPSHYEPIVIQTRAGEREAVGGILYPRDCLLLCR